MKRGVSLPKFLEGKIIEGCWECPFYDGGDSGWGDHCNIDERGSPSMEDCSFLEEVPLLEGSRK